MENINILAEIKNLIYKKVYLIEKNGENFILERIEIKEESYYEEVIEEINKIKNLKIKVFVEIVNFYKKDKYFYIEKKIYKNSQNLKSLKDTENFNIERIKRLATTLCNIVEYFHKNNIYFLNFNPENIYFDEDKNILLDNFGNLERKLIHLSGIKDINKLDALAKEYFAPEVWSNNENNTSDYFSIGILISELSTNIPAKKLVKKKLPIKLKRYGIKDFNLNNFVFNTTQYYIENRLKNFEECKKSLTEQRTFIKGGGISPVKAILYSFLTIFILVMLLSTYILIKHNFSFSEMIDTYKLFLGLKSEKLMKKLEQQIAVKIEKQLKEKEEKLKKYLIIKSFPEKAIVSINDEPLGITPLTLGMRVTNATFKLKLEKIGFDPWEKYIRLKDKKTNRIYIKLTKNLYLNTINADDDEITSLVFSFDDKYVATGGKDGIVNIWDSSSWEKITSIKNIKYNPYSLAFSPRKELLVIGSGAGNLIFFDTENWFKVNKFEAHQSPVFSIAFTPDGKYIITGGVDNYLKIWSSKDGDLIQTIKKAHKDVIKDITFSYDTKFFVTASLDKTVKIWRNGLWEKVKSLKFQKPIFSASFGANNILAIAGVAQGNNKSSLYIYNTITWQKEKEFNFKNKDSKSVRFSPDGKFLAVSVENNIYIYRTDTWELVTTLSQHEDNIKKINFSFDGKYLISGDEGGTVIVWDALGLNTLIQ